jgi:hypothetical protein
VGGVSMECEFIKPNGEKCEAQAIKDDIYCFAHSNKPVIIEKRTEAKSLGGRNGKKQMLTPSESTIEVKTHKDALILLEQTINDVRQNKIAVNQANCIGYLCNIMAKIFEQQQIETRLAVLERVVLLERKKVN